MCHHFRHTLIKILHPPLMLQALRSQIMIMVHFLVKMTPLSICWLRPCLCLCIVSVVFSHVVVLVTNVYYINTRTMCVCVSVCLCHARPRERNVVSPRTLRQRKELLLASCRNCLTSSLLERKASAAEQFCTWGGLKNALAIF